jgi:DNA-binding CsgD family transcriptional regulator
VQAWLEDQNGRRFPFDASCSLGRLPGSTVTIDDRQVSRRHALILTHGDGEFWLVDFGSSNGTLLNGQAVTEPRRLNHSDVIAINSHKFLFNVRRDSGDSLHPARGAAWEETEKKFTAYETIKHGVVVLSSKGAVQMASPHASTWLTDYFSDATSRTSLPGELSRWLRKQQDGAVKIEVFGCIGVPLVKVRDRRRLRVQLADSGGGQQVLLLTEQDLTSTQSSLQKLGLTARESEVMIWIAEGKTNAEIGVILKASSRTIDRHVGSILAKLNVENRASAILRVMELLSPASRGKI